MAQQTDHVLPILAGLCGAVRRVWLRMWTCVYAICINVCVCVCLWMLCLYVRVYWICSHAWGGFYCLFSKCTFVYVPVYLCSCYVHLYLWHRRVHNHICAHGVSICIYQSNLNKRVQSAWLDGGDSCIVYFDSVRSRPVYPVSGPAFDWFPAVYMSCLSQNWFTYQMYPFEIVHVSGVTAIAGSWGRLRDIRPARHSVDIYRWRSSLGRPVTDGASPFNRRKWAPLNWPGTRRRFPQFASGDRREQLASFRVPDEILWRGCSQFIN